MAERTRHMSRRGFLGGFMGVDSSQALLSHASTIRAQVAQPARTTATRRLVSQVLVPKQSGESCLPES